MTKHTQNKQTNKQTHTHIYINDGRCTHEIKSRIATAKVAFNKKKTLFTSKLNLDLRKKLVKCYIWYFNPIGAHPSALIGELPRGVPNNLVPFITQTAAGIRGELSIFGDDYDTPDGTALRDYIDVVDLARAHVVAVERMLSGKQRTGYEVFNIGTGRPVSVMELVEGFERANGVKVPYRIVGRRAGDVEAVWADTTLAAEELGWRSDRPLDETLRSAWKWQKSITK